MANTQARIGYGTLFQFGSGGSPETFTTVAEVRNITGPSLSRATPDASHMESPDGYSEFVSGLKDPGEVTLELSFLPENATQDEDTGILSHFDTFARRNYRIVWVGTTGIPATTWEFSAVVQSFQPAAPVDDRMTLSVTFKLSGKPNFI